MRLGIDYGTTNTVVVCSDRGRYPVVLHMTETAIGPVAREVFPSAVVYDRHTGRLIFGADVERCLCRPGAEEQYALIESPKRLMRDYAEGMRFRRDIRPEGFDAMNDRRRVRRRRCANRSSVPASSRRMNRSRRSSPGRRTPMARSAT